MTETPDLPDEEPGILPGDVRQVDIANEHDGSEVDVVDDDEHADPNQEDIGTDDPYAEGDEEDDEVLSDDEIDGLPDVGEVDLDEEPILDELTEEESSG